MSGRMLAGVYRGVYALKFVGDVRLTLGTTAVQYVNQMFKDPKFQGVLVDLSEANSIDSTVLGVLARLSIRAAERFDYVPTLVSTRADITRILVTMGFDEVYNIIQKPLECTAQLIELPKQCVAEEAVRGQVIDAHRTLMSMNAHNRDTFKDLVATLEGQDGEEPTLDTPASVLLHAPR